MQTRFIALAVAATLGLGSVSAFAQDYHRGDRGDRGQHGWQQREHRVEQNRRDWSYNQRYSAPRYNQPSYVYRDNRYDNRYDNGDLVGAAVIGALAGAVLGQVTSNSAPAYGAYDPNYGYQAPAYAYPQQPAYAYPQPGYGYPAPGYGSYAY